MMNEGRQIEAFDFETNQSVGVFQSCQEASRKLFIKSVTTITGYINGRNGMTFKGKRVGVKSYKDGKRYTFKAI